MIKFILIVVLCVALTERASAKIEEKIIGKDGYRLSLDTDDDRCCEDTCLATANSKKISDAILYTIHANEDIIFEVLRELKILDFLYGFIQYQEFADWIVANDYNYIGYERLQSLVKRYKVCKKVCKVYYQLRKAIKGHAAEAQLYEIVNEDGSKTIEVSGNLIVLSDVLSDLEGYFRNDHDYTTVEFTCRTFIADIDFRQEYWSGRNIIVKSTVFIVPVDVVFDTSARLGKKSHQIIFHQAFDIYVLS